MGMGPRQFQTRIKTVWGEDGRAWLRRLPGQVKALSERWQIEVDPPFEQLSYNFVAPGRSQDGSPIVLKIGVPRPELTREINALKLYAGRGTCRLLAADERLGAMVLERLFPGTMLTSELNDETATAAAAQLMKQLWRPVPAEKKALFRPMSDWAVGLGRLRQSFAGGTGPFPADLVTLAERLFTELLASAGPDVLLHGDCHHFNILKGRADEWVAIDPKGMLGEPAADCYALLKNPGPAIYEAPDLKQILDRRLDVLAAELDLERGQIQRWGIAMAVLSGWWSYEDGEGGWEGPIRVAETMKDL